ncbi:MAG: K(+)-transporting ATPase subunit F [Syntrophobacteraceae bacterium]|nr:K(+)-transporting ATPase subunit F [Syntrophobacteraceae bacterium]
MPALREGIGKALNMVDTIVGIIGVALIVYLLVTLVRPDRF